MCLMVYVAAAQPLEIVAWDEEHPGFHTDLLKAADAPVAARFSLPSVVFAGSYERCGCAFGRTPDAAFDEPSAIIAADASRSAFALYVARAVGRGGGVQIYACWAGDEALPGLSIRAAALSTVLADGFGFEQRELVEVIADG